MFLPSTYNNVSTEVIGHRDFRSSREENRHTNATYLLIIYDTLALFLSPSSLICDKCLFHSVIFIYYDYG